MSKPRELTHESIQWVPKKDYDKIRKALKLLLNDTQHSEHNCGDTGCPVENARMVLSKIEDEDYDPTPHCTWCGAMSAKNCKCPPRAEND